MSMGRWWRDGQAMTTTTANADLIMLVWVETLLLGVVFGFIVAVLTFQQTKGSFPAALLAGLAAGGATILGAHQLLS